MSRTARILSWLCVVAAFACVSPAAGDAISEKRKAQNKLLARRAARADAVRKLAERIGGLNVTSNTAVRDFVTESDTIRTALDAHLMGMKDTPVKHLADGSCQVEMQIKLSQVIAKLKGIYNRHYKGDRIKAGDFDKMTTTNKITVIKETGSGIPRGELQPDQLTPPASGASQASFSGAGAAARAYWARHCTARGRLGAERDARDAAIEKLTARIKGLSVTSKTTVKDFVAESDKIKTSVEAYIKGMSEVGRRYHKDELVVEVEMQVKLRQFYLRLKSWSNTHLKGDDPKLREVEQAVVTSKHTIIRETGMGIPNERYLKASAPADVRRTVALATAAPDWATKTIRATGTEAIDPNNTNKAQARLMAKRAAEIDALRKLAEKINALRITSNTSVRDFVGKNDEIRTSLLTFQQGADVIEESVKDGTAQITIEISLTAMWNAILHYQRTLNITIE